MKRRKLALVLFAALMAACFETESCDETPSSPSSPTVQTPRPEPVYNNTRGCVSPVWGEWREISPDPALSIRPSVQMEEQLRVRCLAVLVPEWVPARHW